MPSVDEILHEQLPAIKEKLKSKLGQSLEAIDDKDLEKALTEIHKGLPFGVRAVLRRKLFISLCFKYKDKLTE